VAAVSAGVHDGVPILDLNYPEDRDATVDFNVVMTESQAFVEVQGSGEEAVFSAEQMASMLELAKKGVSELITKQKAAILAADKAGPADLASLAQLFG
jgi:ribonuclease PH